MFKLKIINKPKMIKMKCNIEFPDVVLANLQEKEATPTKEKQEIKADQQYDGLSKVVVNAIPNEYIIPTGTLEITTNGNYNVKDKENANVNIPEKQLGTKRITSNGTYKATDDNLDGYSEVEVATSGVNIWDYFNETVIEHQIIRTIKKLPPITFNSTSLHSCFAYMSSIKEFDLSNFDTSNVTSMAYAFQQCSSLKNLDLSNFDTSKVTEMNDMFNYCLSLETLNLSSFETSNVRNINYMFQDCYT